MSLWCKGIVKQKLSPTVIKKKLDELISSSRKEFPSNACFSHEWLVDVLIKIDELWYKNQLFKNLQNNYTHLEIYFDTIDNEQDAAYIHDKKSTISIHINRNLFNSLFENNERGYHSGGLLCNDRLICFLHVLLHETVHILLTLCEKIGIADDKHIHGKKFQNLVKNFFGQTDTQHGLIRGYDQTHDLNDIHEYCKNHTKIDIFLNEKWHSGSVIKKQGKMYHVKVNNDIFKTHAGLLRIPQS